MGLGYIDHLIFLIQPELMFQTMRLQEEAPAAFTKEGRWRRIDSLLKPGDFVMMQFGHNEGSQSGYKQRR